jgi:hypothetical protein
MLFVKSRKNLLMGKKRLTPVQAIRAKCIDCSNSQLKEIRTCQIVDCAFYPFRMGKNPNRKRKTEKGVNLPKTG